MKPRTILLPAVMGAAGLALWYGLHHAIGADRQFLLPRPDAVLSALADNRAVLLQATLNTGMGALLGLLLAVVISFGLALGLSFSPAIRAGFYPYLMILQMTPVVVFAPILILWVGPGLKSVVIITFLICFFPLVVNTTQGLVSTDRNLVDLFRLYRASRWQALWSLHVPSALPYFFTGLRIAATLAPIAALVGDYTAGSSAGNGGGLGFQTLIFSAQAKYPALFATAVVTCVLGFMFVGIVLVLSWLALRHWHEAYRNPDRS
jgi:NitT/TauT family transport system permease protein